MPDQVLRDELLNDPTGKGYAGKTHQQMADLLNAKNVWITKQKISSKRMLWDFAKTEAWGRLIDLIENAVAPAAQKRVALGLRDVLTHTPILDTDDPAEVTALSSMLGTLVSAGVLTDAQRNAFLDQTNMYLTRANIIGYDNVTAAQVTDALSGGPA